MQGLHGPEANLVEFPRNWQHVVDAHAGRKQTLMRITQHQFGYSQGILIAH